MPIISNNCSKPGICVWSVCWIWNDKMRIVPLVAAWRKLSNLDGHRMKSISPHAWLDTCRMLRPKAKTIFSSISFSSLNSIARGSFSPFVSLSFRDRWVLLEHLGNLTVGNLSSCAIPAVCRKVTQVRHCQVALQIDVYAVPISSCLQYRADCKIIIKYNNIL